MVTNKIIEQKNATLEAARKGIAQVEPQSPSDLPGNKEKEKTMTDSNFERLEQLIVKLKEELESKIDKLEDNLGKEIKELNKKVVDLDKKVVDLDKKVVDLDKKVDVGFKEVEGLQKRLELPEKISLIIVTTLSVSFLGGLAKFLFFNN